MHAYPCVSGSCSKYVSFRSLYGATSVLLLVAVVLYGSVVGGGMLVEVAATENVPIPLTVLSFMLLSLAQLFIAIVSHKPDINNVK
jgi:translation initiation factor 2 gamma subunit (eIF-2gamma)